MSQALSVVNQALFERAPVSYNEQQLQLIKDTYAKGASDDEFRLFVEIARHRKLDILKGHMCLIKFKSKELGRDVFQPVVKIDGYRGLAEDSGLYEGQTNTEWCGKDGVWKDVWLDDSPPAAARAGVHRKGFREPVYAVARFSSYAQKWPDGNLKGQWATMPDLMLAKCAESLALRKAFPDQLGGLYTRVEMDQAQNDHSNVSALVIRQPQAAKTATVSPEEKAVNEALYQHCLKLKKTEKNARPYYEHIYGKLSFAEKQKAVLDLNLTVAAPAEVVIEAEIVEEEREEETNDQDSDSQGRAGRHV